VLYLDSSALIKHYVVETGSRTLNARLSLESTENAYSSVIAFAEILTALARRAREKIDTVAQSFLVRRTFESDWRATLGHVDLNDGVLALIAKLVDNHPLKSSDAIHLASAIWLRDKIRGRSWFGHKRTFLRHVRSTTKNRRIQPRL
jgi:uncharacterized protein